MPKKNPTSFVLDDSIQKIKDDLAPIYGLKNILSAGLVLFDALPPEKREEVLMLVNEQSADEPDIDEKELEIRRKIIQILRASQNIGTKKKAARRANPAG